MTDYLRTTPCGEIRGTSCQWPGVASYRGIRYAAAERWAYPVRVTAWDGVYDATAYGSCSYQPRAFYDESKVTEKAFYYNEFRKGESYTYSEDCLFLNIWTPENASADAKLPVIFYIHGGGFVGGCGHEKHFDGPIWPTKGCVAVTINYRLGPLGFFALPALKEEAGHCGNYGLFDQIEALKWVRENIAAFGGDADNIMIMGQSAGAMSVQQLCLSPLTKGLFAKAVLCSGGGVGTQMDIKPAESQYKLSEKVMECAGCNTLDELRAVPADALFTAWQAAVKAIGGGGLAAVPVLDDCLLPNCGTETFAAHEQHHIPYIIGMTSEDIIPPVLYTMLQEWGRGQGTSEPAAYGYFFDRQLPGDEHGAWHSSDLWYWFGTLAHCWRPMTEKDEALSAQMSDYLTNFAKTGNPNGAALPAWKPLGGAQTEVLRLGEAETHMGSVSMEQLIWTMNNKPAVGE